MSNDVDFWENRAMARQTNMVKANVYRSEHKAMLDEAEARCRAIINEVESKLERLAVEAFGKPNKARERLLAPPKTPVKVKCWHCGERYLSSEMRLEYRPACQHNQVELLGDSDMVEELRPLWWCKNDGCLGAGFGHDIHEVKEKAPRKKKIAKEPAP